MTPGGKGTVGGSNKMLSMHEAADYIGVHYQTLASKYTEWKIPCHRFDSRVRFRIRDLEAFLERTRQP